MIKKRPHARPPYDQALEIVAYAREKKATSLDLSINGLSALPSLEGLPQVDDFRLVGSEIKDVSQLSKLISLRSLNLRGGAASDLRPISNLVKLESLDLQNTPISDLAPLSNLIHLKVLNLGRTKISNLKPLSKLTKLQSLNLTRTAVSALAPLRAMVEMERLDLSMTSISHIAPLSQMTNLLSLDIHKTQVSDLTPLTQLVHLIDLARSEHYGLFHAHCPLADQKLLSFVELSNPLRTLKTINYLRELQGLPAYYPYDQYQLPPTDTTQKPPRLPPQQPGPHFALQADGVIGFASTNSLDSRGNNVALIMGILPQVRDLARMLQASLAEGNVPHSFLHDAANAYAEEIEKPIDDIDFWKLAGLGIQLENAASAAERKIADRDLPALSDPQKARLDSVVHLHGPLILATAPGQAIIAAIERYSRDPGEIESRRHATSLVNSLKVHPELMAPDAAEFLERSISAAAQEPANEKNVVYGRGASSNTALVLTAAASVYVVPTIIGTFVGGPLGAVAGAIFGQIGFKVLEKTPTFDALTERAAEELEALPRQSFKKYLKFVMANETALRGLAGKHRTMLWLHRHLDWLLANAK